MRVQELTLTTLRGQMTAFRRRNVTTEPPLGEALIRRPQYWSLMTDGEPGETGPNTTLCGEGCRLFAFLAREGAFGGSLVENVLSSARRRLHGSTPQAAPPPAPTVEAARRRRSWAVPRCLARGMRRARKIRAAGVPPGLRPTARRFRPSWGRPEPRSRFTRGGHVDRGNGLGRRASEQGTRSTPSDPGRRRAA